MNYQKVVEVVESFAENYKDPEESESEMMTMLDCLREYRDEHWGKDNRVYFISALIDGLGYGSFWRLLQPEQFISVSDIVKSLNERDIWEDKDIDVTIYKLDELGIDTTPF